MERICNRDYLCILYLVIFDQLNKLQLWDEKNSVCYFKYNELYFFKLHNELYNLLIYIFVNYRFYCKTALPNQLKHHYK